MVSWLEELQRREAAAGARADELRERIAELSEQLAGQERVLSRLAITRETMIEILAGAAESGQAEAGPQLSVRVVDGGGESGGGSPVVVMLVPPREVGGSDGVVLPQDYRDILEIVGDGWQCLASAP